MPKYTTWPVFIHWWHDETSAREELDTTKYLEEMARQELIKVLKEEGYIP